MCANIKFCAAKQLLLMPSSSQTESGTKAIGSNIFSRNFDSYGVAKHTINTGASEAVAYGPKERVSNFPAFSSPFSLLLSQVYVMHPMSFVQFL